MHNCNHSNSAPTQVLTSLPESQKGLGRHKCCTCAYEEGLNHSQNYPASSEVEECLHGNRAPTSMLRGLPENQGGPDRHKCCICAYAIASGNETDGTEVNTDVKTIPAAETNRLTKEEQPAPKVKNAGATKRKARVGKFEGSDSARNNKIGLIGEELVLEYLKTEMPQIDSVEHVSQTQGDGLGYDILAKYKDGNVALIEVKTTTSIAPRTQFFLSQNELEVCRANIDNYFIFRVYALDEKNNSGRFFVIPGPELEKNFQLTPTNYRVT